METVAETLIERVDKLIESHKGDRPLLSTTGTSCQLENWLLGAKGSRKRSVK